MDAVLAETNEVHDATAVPATATVAAGKPQRLSRKQKAAATVATEPAASKKESALSYEAKYRLVDRALRAFLSLGGPSSDATLIFLDALRDQ